MKNATNNFNIDHNIIDPGARDVFEKLAQKWPITLQTSVDVAFDGVAEILRMHKKEKLQSGAKKSDYIPPIIHVFTNTSIIKFFC